jgi:hypothetical protein
MRRFGGLCELKSVPKQESEEGTYGLGGPAAGGTSESGRGGFVFFVPTLLITTAEDSIT